MWRLTIQDISTLIIITTVIYMKIKNAKISTYNNVFCLQVASVRTINLTVTLEPALTEEPVLMVSTLTPANALMGSQEVIVQYVPIKYSQNQVYISQQVHFYNWIEKENISDPIFLFPRLQNSQIVFISVCNCNTFIFIYSQ